MTAPIGIVDAAVNQAAFSPCRSQRGAVVFSTSWPLVCVINGRGHNHKPEGFDCDGSAACKATCRHEAIHAEQQALLNAGPAARGADLLHVKIVNGRLVPSGGPSCVQCSKLALAAGIAGVWLYHDTGWQRYDATTFHALSSEAGTEQTAPAEPPEELGDGIHTGDDELLDVLIAVRVGIEEALEGEHGTMSAELHEALGDIFEDVNRADQIRVAQLKEATAGRSSSPTPQDEDQPAKQRIGIQPHRTAQMLALDRLSDEEFERVMARVTP